MLRSYRLIWNILVRRERRNFLLLIFLTIIMAIFEVASVAAILPFLTIVANPEILETNSILRSLINFFGIQDNANILLVLGVGLLVLFLIGMIVRAGVTYLQIRFSLMRGYSLARRVLNNYLLQDYTWFLSRNSSELSQSLLSEIDTVIRESVLPAVLVMSNLMVLILVASLLFIVEPIVAIGAAGLLVLSYFAIYLLLRSRIREASHRRVLANRQRFHIVHDIIGGIKEIKIMGQEQVFLKRFQVPAAELAINQALGQIMTRLPRFALEALVYGAFIVMILLLIFVRGDAIEDIVPLLGLIGVAGVKLFPAVQQIYQQISLINLSSAALERLHKSVTAMNSISTTEKSSQPINLSSKIELKNVKFRYSGTDDDTLKGVTTTIPCGNTVGIVGGTGSGKSTLVDIILGLLAPDSGEVLIDGVPLTRQLCRSWQSNIGYVPQSIFLADCSIAENIAFGVEPKKIDFAAVECAAKIAHIHDFIVNDLPNGYMTEVGERGVRLSGGQRQRIGIARALYKDPNILILDEATSALDNVTESHVMTAIHALARKKTILMIAHRMSTVEACDKILVLEGGLVSGEGTYIELLKGNSSFRRIAQTTE